MHHARGFTLIEVVIAMTIVGLGVVTLMELFSMGLRLGARSSAATEASSYGRQAMDELLARRNLADGSEQGNLQPNRRWRLDVRSAPADQDALTLSNAWDLKEITLDMIVLDGGRERHVELKTLKLMKKQ